MTGVLLTTKHGEAFGGIIIAYAHAEVSIKFTLSAVLDTNLETMFVLAEPYTSLQLRNVANAIVKLKMPIPAIEAFVQLTGKLKEHGTLRNHVAHAMWVKGTRPGSIRPARMGQTQGVSGRMRRIIS